MAGDPVSNFAVNPVEAIDFFRQKINLPTKAWTDIWEGMHSRAFVVAGANTEALVADFRNAIDKAIAEGKSLDWFRKEFDKIVAAHGWNYKGERRWRQAVIFNTNLRMAYATGRWAQIKRLADRRPYLRYKAVLDDRTRPLHRAWDDVVLRWDDPWWQTHFPPNGWNCRCSIQQLSERDMTRLNLKVSPHAPASPLIARGVKTPEGVKYVLVPKGIDPGFAYNPGEAAFGRGAASLAQVKHGPWTALEGLSNVDKAPLSKLVVQDVTKPLAGMIKAGDESTIRNLVTKVLGGDERIVVDPTGAHVQLDQAIADRWLAHPDGSEAYIPLLPELITQPSELRLGFMKNQATGEVMLRRRYVKLLRLKNGKLIGMAADVDGRMFSSFTFFGASNEQSLNALRQGFLLWVLGL
jgi:SPP1 gp7 family putative phage head morphogenesis protein